MFMEEALVTLKKSFQFAVINMPPPLITSTALITSTIFINAIPLLG